ncbi:hypothetical protein EDD15DRAFT_2199810 [Pisolithus albus]|nr:hypothetical protein EDD15DRAFT_2199810 [Pisolithus albus]
MPCGQYSHGSIPILAAIVFYLINLHTGIKMSNPQDRKVRFYNTVEIMTIEQASQSSRSPRASADQSPSPLSEDVSTASQPKKTRHSSQSSVLRRRTTVEVGEDNQMDWMDDLERGGPSPPLYIPDTEEDATDILEDLSQPPPAMPVSMSLIEGSDPPAILTATDDAPPESVDDNKGDDTEEFDELETGQVPPPPPTPPEAATPTASGDGSNGDRPAGTFEDKRDWESGFNFARAERKRMRSKFCDLFNTFFEPVPSHAKRMKMEHEGLVNPGADEAVFRMVYEMQIRYRHTRLHYEFGFNTHLHRHIVEAMRRIADDLGYSAKKRIDLIEEAWRALQILEAMEASEDPYRSLGFERFWFNNIFLEMGRWTEDTFREELLHIPLGKFKMADHVSHLIPHWTVHGSGKYDGFVSLWWLGSGEGYGLNAPDGNLAAITNHAHAYFKNLWPMEASPIRLFVENIQSDSIASHVQYLKDLEGSIERLSHDIDHMFSRLVSLSQVACMSSVLYRSTPNIYSASMPDMHGEEFEERG